MKLSFTSHSQAVIIGLVDGFHNIYRKTIRRYFYKIKILMNIRSYILIWIILILQFVDEERKFYKKYSEENGGSFYSRTVQP